MVFELGPVSKILLIVRTLNYLIEIIKWSKFIVLNNSDNGQYRISVHNIHLFITKVPVGWGLFEEEKKVQSGIIKVQ